MIINFLRSKIKSNFTKPIHTLVIIFCLSFPVWVVNAQPLLETDLTEAIYKKIKILSGYREILNYPLTVVTFDGFIEAKALKNSLVYMAESFLACGVRFQIHHLHKHKARNAVAFDPYSEFSQQMMENWLGDLPSNMAKPILIYAPMFSEMGTLKAVSLPERKNGISADVPPHLVNVAWINSVLVPAGRWETIVDRIIDIRSINYTTEAHELGHLFLRSGHVKGDLFSANIMANGDTLFVGSRFTREQCDFVRSNPIVK